MKNNHQLETLILSTGKSTQIFSIASMFDNNRRLISNEKMGLSPHPIVDSFCSS